MPGDFQIFWDPGAGFSFTNGYIYVEDASATPPADESNHLYIIALEALPD